VRLVAPDGSQVGIKAIEEARWLADNLGLDLVEVAADARPPVVRMMDYGKFKYEQSVKAREARKKQTRTVIKEVQFRPKIGKSDFEVKRLRVERFLNDHDKVKVTMRFRGREVTHPEIGRDILKRLADSVQDFGVVEQMPRLDGKQMTMVIAPLKREEREARSEAKQQEQAPKPPAEKADAAAPAQPAGDAPVAPEAASAPATEAAAADNPLPDAAEEPKAEVAGTPAPAVESAEEAAAPAPAVDAATEADTEAEVPASPIAAATPDENEEETG
jgi:translation initiation factor IF-3